MLDHLGVAQPEDRNLGRDLAFRRRLETAGQDAVATMLRFFEIEQFARNGGHWPEPGFKLFVSHVSDARERMLPLLTALSDVGIISFMAHEAIRPAANWRDVLMEALRSMDALLSFHSGGFRASEWCGQEIGFALGRGVPIVPVMDGEIPAGFLSAVQGARWNPAAMDNTIQVVIDAMLGSERAAQRYGEALARKLKFAGSYGASDFYVEHLAPCGRLSAAAEADVRLALRLNDQVRGRDNAEALIDQG